MVKIDRVAMQQYQTSFIKLQGAIEKIFFIIRIYKDHINEELS